MNKHFIQEILNSIDPLLKSQGYKKTGNTFSRILDDLTHAIKLQSSQSSTSEILKVTVNIEIRSSKLYSLQYTSIPEKQISHYRQRIGSYCEPPFDKWWIIDDNISLQSAINELNSLLVQNVLPSLSKIISVEDLKKMWLKGECPGLTEGQRKEYLALLEKAFI